LTPDELAALHPRLYHVTSPGALPGILRHGLLPTSCLLALFEVVGAEQTRITRQRRSESKPITHPVHGVAIITDNIPLNEAKLAACLDDGLTPVDWLEILNQRVFFWPDERSLDDLLDARANRGRDRLVLAFDTLSLARQYGLRMELSPINSGSTLYQPARRGRSTFSPLPKYDYATWRRLRSKSKPDRIREVTVVGGIDRVEDHLVEHFIAAGRSS
jgi:hypothetical protein